jgi:hypothetical protein
MLMQAKNWHMQNLLVLLVDFYVSTGMRLIHSDLHKSFAHDRQIVVGNIDFL